MSPSAAFPLPPPLISRNAISTEPGLPPLRTRCWRWQLTRIGRPRQKEQPLWITIPSPLPPATTSLSSYPRPVHHTPNPREAGLPLPSWKSLPIFRQSDLRLERWLQHLLAARLRLIPTIPRRTTVSDSALCPEWLPMILHLPSGQTESHFLL
jgi:hypothetical protein